MKQKNFSFGVETEKIIMGIFGLPTEFLIECLEKSGVEIKGSDWKE